MTFLTGQNRIYVLLATVAIAVLLAVGWAAYAGAQEGTPETENTESTTTTMMEASGSDNDAGVPYEGPSGIWVSGNGKASGSPDIAVLSLGVESVEDTAAEARTNAATAMNEVTDVLTDAGIAESDIQTRHFNINPRYQSVEIERCDSDDGSSEGEEEGTTEKSCYKVWESRLIGYSVSHQASVKIRNLANAGDIIDKAAEAAGNLVRINGISFSIEDPQALQDEARANAVEDMKRRAEMLAELSGVELGRLVYLTEGASYVPPQPVYARAEAAFAASDASTSISPGELDVSVRVQGVFLIAGVVETEKEQ